MRLRCEFVDQYWDQRQYSDIQINEMETHSPANAGQPKLIHLKQSWYIVIVNPKYFKM